MGWTLVKDKLTGHVYDVQTVRDNHEVRKEQPGEDVRRPVRIKYATRTSPATKRSGSAREATNNQASEAKEEKS